MARKYIKPILDTWEDRSMLIINSHRGGGGMPTDGLVAYYPFNGNANDESGNGNNPLSSDVTFVEDRNGIPLSAVESNGSQNIKLPDDFFNPSFDPFTIAGRFYRNTNTPGRVLNFFGVTNTNVIQLRFNNTDLRLYVFVRDNSNSGIINVQVPIDLNLSEWYFFALVKNDDNSVEMYINEISYMLGSVTGELIMGSGTKYLFSDGNINFNGKQDDIMIYNRALTPEEITQLYNE